MTKSELQDMIEEAVEEALLERESYKNLSYDKFLEFVNYNPNDFFK